MTISMEINKSYYVSKRIFYVEGREVVNFIISK